MQIDTGTLVMIGLSGVMSLHWWNTRRYMSKIDNLEQRVTKIETIMNMLGDINTKISTIETDVAVIKSKVE